jgi:DNA-binding SARP family transcriptional activator
VHAEGRTLPDALVGGRQGRLVLAYLACERSRAVRKEELADLLWPDRLPESWSASLSAVISRLRRLLTEAGLDGAEAIMSTGGAYRLVLPPDAVVDLDELEAAVAASEAAAAAGDVDRALEAAATAETIGARGFLTDDCEWVDRQRDVVRVLRLRAALARSAAHIVGGRPARAVEAARDALALDESCEAAYRQLMLGLAATGERAEALRAWERCRATLVDELGVDPSPETEAVYLEVLGASPVTAPTATALPSGVVTFLLTDIVESSALWDNAPDDMSLAVERHDALVAEVVAAHGGTLLKAKLEGDATVSVFGRASDGAAAALALQDAVAATTWPAAARPQLRMALHTGEAFERGGDYFGPALNRAARLRSLAGAGDVLLSQAVTELVRDHLPAAAALRDLGHRDLRGLSRGENVYALVHADAVRGDEEPGGDETTDTLVPPALPAALSSSSPFVGRGGELHALEILWQRATGGAPTATFVGGEPGVGKSRLAGEIASLAHARGAIVLYGRCDEDLAAPLQPFIEALRSLVPALGPTRTRSVRGVDELARVVPEVAEQLPDRALAVRADPDTERLALFDAVTSLLAAASTEAPVLLVLDDLHWAGKTTLSLLRHLLRGAKAARLLVVGTYRSTELGRTHPLAETLADLRRDADAHRISLSGLAEEDIDAYLSAIGIDDRALGRELAEVTSGNPFFLIEVLRHVEETGGTWSPGTLPEGVRDATGRRLARLSDATNAALSVAAVVGMTFDLALVEQAQATELVDEIAEACQAGLVVEEPGSVGTFRFAHALVRQVLLAELVTVKRVRLHKTIAELLEATPVRNDPDARLADLAYHWSQCASLAGATKAVDACRRAGDRAMERLAYEEAADLYAMALQVLDDGNDADDDEPDTRAALHLARCDAVLTAGDVAGARAAIDALEGAARGSERLAAWYTTYEGLLAVLAEPDRLTEIVQSIGAAAEAMRALGDLRGEARAHYVHASALERLGQIGAAERALDAALAAARRADDRRLADSILAESPPAALWGPSSISRASGRCLDVVRVLRVNDGAPAVEAVALRCQAVLEALRGRSHAARRIVAKARRTVERLGLVHRQLETEVAAGLIELLAGDAPSAELLLRSAYEGLRERGLGGEAAQAAAFLGRSLLLQDRVHEADGVAAEAEALAGVDLKAAIAWRGVRAEAAARRGDAARALVLAREAVELASSTDALLLLVDARLALANVLRAIGDEIGADEEARRALEACEAKGATALAARSGLASAVAPDPTARPADTAMVPVRPNSAIAAATRFQDAFNRGDLDAVALGWHPDLRSADRRPLLAGENRGRNAAAISAANLAAAFEFGTRFAGPKPLVSRGDHAALVRWDLRGPGAEWPLLLVVRIDEDGRFTDWVVFDVRDRRAANQELDRLGPAAAEHDTTAWRAAARNAVAANEHDWDAFMATLSPRYQMIDRRSTVTAHETAFDEHRTMFSLDDFAYEIAALELRGDRSVLCRQLVWFRDGAVEEAEVVSLTVIEVDEAGLITRQIGFGPDDLDSARAALHAGDELLATTLAERAVRRFAEALSAHDWDAVQTLLAPTFERRDRRRAVTAPDTSDSTDHLSELRMLFSLDDWDNQLSIVEAHGEYRVLVENVVWFRDGAVAEAEWVGLEVIDVDAYGRFLRRITFSADDLDAARAELHAGDESLTTLAERAVRRFADAINAHDWDAVQALLAPTFERRDRRRAVTAPDTGDALFDYRQLFSLDDWRVSVRVVQAHGEHRILVRWETWFRDGNVAEAEVDDLLIYDVDAAGRIVRQTAFAADDIDAARAELVSAQAASPPVENDAWRAALRMRDVCVPQGDWDAFVATLAEDFEFDDNRSGAQLNLRGAAALDVYRTVFALDEWRWEGTLLATRSEHLALVRDDSTFADGHAGRAEVASLSVIESTPAGRVRRISAYDDDDVDAALAELERRYREQPKAPGGSSVGPNAAWYAQERVEHAQNAHDLDALLHAHSPGFTFHDRRAAMLIDLDGEAALSIFRVGTRLHEFRMTSRLLAARGEHLALVEAHAVFQDGAAGPAEISNLVVVEADDDGRMLRNVLYDVAALDEALAELDRRHREQTREVPWSAVRPNLAWHAQKRAEDAMNAHDLDALLATHSPGFTQHDRRAGMLVDLAGEAAVSTFRVAAGLDEFRMTSRLLAVGGEHLALVEAHTIIRDGESGPAEISNLSLVEADDEGRLVRSVLFDLGAREEALAELDRWHDRVAVGTTTLVRPNSAWYAEKRVEAALNAQDIQRLRAELSASFTLHDRRLALSADLDGDEAISIFEVGAALDEYRCTNDLVAVRGEHLALVMQRAVFRDGASGPAEVSTLAVVEIGDASRVLCHVLFDPWARDAAVAELDRRNAERRPASDEAAGNAAWHASLLQEAACAADDWDAYEATLHPSYEYVERRRGLWLPPGASPLSVNRAMFDLDRWEFRRALLAERGDRLALVRQSCRFEDGAVGPAESSAVAVLEVAEDGRVIREMSFDVDDVDDAIAELDARWRDGPDGRLSDS